MKETIVGLLFFASLAIVLYFAFTLGGPGSLSDVFSDEKEVLRINFTEITGLKEKDSVNIAGQRQGAVVGFENQEDGTITVLARVDLSQARLFSDARAEMINTSALGGKAINIYPGNPATGSYPDGRVMEGEYVPDFLQEAGKLMVKVEQGIDGILQIVGDIKDIVADVKAGKGPVGTLLRDETTAGRIKSIMGNVDGLTAELNIISRDVAKMTQDINNAESIAGRLIHDEQMGRDLSEMLQKLNRTSTDIEAAITEVREITEQINSGKGTIGALINDPEMQDQVEEMLQVFTEAASSADTVLKEAEEVLKGVNEGKGTVGRLFQDETLYNDLVRTVNTLQSGFEDIREQAPITTFASLAFQVFQ